MHRLLQARNPKGKTEMTYKQAVEFLDSVRSNKGMVLGLECMRRLMEELGNPQDKLKFVQVAGTNGKGSTAAFIAKILEEDGRKVGRYTSPAVYSFEEQYYACKRYITKREAEEGLSVIAAAYERMEVKPTAFEMETALAFWFFEKIGCEIAIIEAGLGGDEDATNIVTTTICSVITSISIDHRRILGDTTAKIAAHKAGIVKPGTDVVSIEQDEAAMQVIIDRCKEQNARLHIVKTADARLVSATKQELILFYRDFEALRMHMRGIYQKDNAALAIETARVLGASVQAIRRGIESTVWPGRFEKVFSAPDIILDGAHNADGIRRLRESIDFYYGVQPVTYIMGVLADKDYEEEIAILLGRAARVYTVTPDSPRACSAADLKKAIKRRYAQLKVTTAESVEEALNAAVEDKDIIVVCGTLTILRRAADWIKIALIAESNQNNCAHDFFGAEASAE